MKGNKNDAKKSNIYQNLLNQFDRVFRHCRQGSIRTRHRYAEAFKRFLGYLAENFRLERIANIAPKHFRAYISDLCETGKSPSYIKTEASAIRFYHDQIPNRKYHRLPSNSDLSLQRRRFGGVDRTWSAREFNLFVAKALERNRQDYVGILCLARYAGLRLHECFRLDTAAARKAIDTGILTVRGKGGQFRAVPINLSIRIQLKKMLVTTPSGHKLFVLSDDKTHLAMHRFENFISYYGPKLQDPDSQRPLHFHGLRHTWAAESYDDFLQKDFNEREARKKMAELLGHHRDSVTKIYLSATVK